MTDTRGRRGRAVAAVALTTTTLAASCSLADDTPPGSLEDFEQICENGGRGDPLPEAAPYSGQPPHPLAYFSTTGPSLSIREPGSTREPAPEDVQLVACGFRYGRGSDDPLAVCDYSADGFSTTTTFRHYQGQLGVNVYEARTGDRLGFVTVKGPAEADCAEQILVSPDEHEPTEEDFFTEPSDRTIARALDDFVAGEPDPGR